jgi:hypothetical protein
MVDAGRSSPAGGQATQSGKPEGEEGRRSGNGIPADARSRFRSTRAATCGRYAVVAVAVAAALLVAGCSGSNKPPVSTPSSVAPVSPTPSVDASVAAATEAAVAAYSGYFHAYAAAAAKANPDDPNLATYIGGGLLLLSQHNLRNLKDHGAVELGDVKTAVTGSSVNLGASPPTVTVQACVDYTDYRLVYRSNQSPVPNSALKLKRYTTTATVNLFADGRWRVAADTPHRDTPC